MKRRLMNKLLTLALALAVLVALSVVGGATASAEDEAETGVWPAIAGENGTSYANLFEVILTEDCYQLWYDYCAAVVGEDAAADTVAALQASISSELYGQAAIEAFADGGMAFDCWYINDVDTFRFEGDTATVTKTDGSTETHSYEYLGQYLVGEGETMNYMGMEFPVAFPCDVYKSTDEAGEFNYFFFREDTMETTYHLEFRYGKDLEELQGYFVGPYAYWLAAGIDESADAETIEKVTALFCLENMDYAGHTPGALAQLEELGFVGTWNADLSPYGEAFAGIELSMTIDENGHGITYMNGMQTRDFEAFALDNGEKGDGAGLYVAYDNEAFEAESAPYTLTENEDGTPVLTLYAEDGVISWVKGEALSFAGGVGTVEDPYLIETAQQLSGIRMDLAANYKLAADIDLAGESWNPIGMFVPLGMEGEEAELPNPDYAFTGTFDGDGHTVSNLVINQPQGYALGLFGCTASAKIENLTVENATVDGSLMTGAVVGYAFDCFVSNVHLTGENTITGHDSEYYGPANMIGGVVAAGMDSVIADSSAVANIVLGDGVHDAGILGGGLEVTSVINGSASGSITAGDGAYGLGGISGCGFGAEAFTNCMADDVTITVGDNCSWLGGVTGYAGGFEMVEAGVPVTVFSGCKVENVSIIAGEGLTGVDAIVGAGFFSEEAAAFYGAPFDAPTVYVIEDCEGSLSLNGETLAAAA